MRRRVGSLEEMGSVAPLEGLKPSQSATRAVDVVAGFIDLPAQCLPLFRRQPALAAAFGLASVCAVGFGTRLSARIGLGRLLLRWVVTGVAIRVALLRHPGRGAS